MINVHSAGSAEKVPAWRSLSAVLVFLNIILLFYSCVSMSARNLGTGGRVTIKQKDLRSGETKSYAAGEKKEDTLHNKYIIVRVLLSKGAQNLIISASAPVKVLNTSIPEVKKFAVSAMPDGTISVNDTAVSGKKAEFSCRDGFLSFNKKSYRGTFLVYLSGGGLMLVNKIELEQYLYGVLPSEVSYSWEKEVLKAQAVAARTFATYNRLKNKIPEYDLDSNVNSQVYGGRDVEAAATNKAIDETAGEVLVYNEEVIQAFFHANSGGRTASSAEVWGGKFDYLPSVDDPYSENAKKYKWEYSITDDKLGNILAKNGVNSGSVNDISISEHTDSGRAKTVIIHGANRDVAVKGKDLRAYIGVDQLRSTNFEVQKNGSLLVFSGKGWGHGVGMSQEGARQMADEGKEYRDILKYYYKGVKIKKMKVE
jgi:stage II sporulation protein D